MSCGKKWKSKKFNPFGIKTSDDWVDRRPKFWRYIDKHQAHNDSAFLWERYITPIEKREDRIRRKRYRQRAILIYDRLLKTKGIVRDR